MNYGKTAYLKVLDIEKEINFNQENNNFFNCYENSKQNINQNIAYNQTYKLSLENILTQKGTNIFFQIKITLSSTSTSKIGFDILFDGNIIHNETKSIQNVSTDVILLKSFSPISDKPSNVEIKITNLTKNTYVTIENITSIIIGAKGEEHNQNFELRALKYINENNVLLSYIDNNELFYLITPLSEKSLRNDDFSFLIPAISHCFCFETYKNNNEQNNIILYRVDTDKKLYYSHFLNINTEVFIDDEVDIVHAQTCPQSSDELNIIAYIKNGTCYYRTMREGGLSSRKELNLPNGKYKDIKIVSRADSDYIYIVASHENGSNYILHSLIEVDTGNIVEFLNASYLATISKYVDLSFIYSSTIETIKLNISYELSETISASSILESLAIDNLSLHCECCVESYKINNDEEQTYGVRLDKSILTGTDWGSYTDDAVNFSAAYMDFENDIFVDNGWTQRWPFNQIKPCLLKDGKILGYLNPNNFTEFIDGTIPDTTSSDCGYIMIEVPKIYFSITRDDEYIDVKISNTPKDGFVCTPFVYKGEELDKLYISAYLCGHETFDIYGFKMPNNSYVSTSVTIGYSTSRYEILKTYDGNRFEFLPYNVLKLIQCLYIIMFKNTNAQATLGVGYSTERISHKVGLLNKKGMYYGTNTNGGVKFMGIEDIYGTRKQLVTGYYVESDNGSYKPRFIDPYDKNMSYDPTQISTYITSDKPFTKASKWLRVVDDINEDAINTGFFGSTAGTSTEDTTIGFCDLGCVTGQASSFIDFGWTGTGESNGMFAQLITIATDATPKRSARLVYYPEA